MPIPTRPDDVLLTSEAPLGRTALIRTEEPLLIGQRVFCLRGRKGVLDSRFLYYALQTNSVQADLQGRATGTTVVGIRQPELRKVRIPAPSYDEQLGIAEVLGSMDDKIAANIHVESLILSKLDAIYQHAISAAPSTSRPLFEVFDVGFGEAFKGEHFSQPGIGRPLIRIRDLKTYRPQTWTTETRANEIEIQPGDVVMGMDAEFRPTWWLGKPGMLNQRVCRVRGRFTGPAFVAEALRKPLAAIENEKSGTTVIHLNKSDLERARIDVPSLESLADFEATGEPLVQARVAIALENRRLAETRDELLPLLMSGRIRVRGAEKIVEEVS